jgi:hypothetical protein
MRTLYIRTWGHVARARFETNLFADFGSSIKVNELPSVKFSALAVAACFFINNLHDVERFHILWQ